MTVLRGFVVLVLVFFVAGCGAFHRKAVSMDDLQSRVNDMEKKVQDKDDEIQELKDQVKDLNNELKKAPAAKAASAAKKSTNVSKAEKDIIRVNASAKDIQTTLKNAGYYSGPVDGRIGEKTKQAVKAFQQANGLNGDGVVGQRTWDKLKAYLNK